LNRNNAISVTVKSSEWYGYSTQAIAHSRFLENEVLGSDIVTAKNNNKTPSMKQVVPEIEIMGSFTLVKAETRLIMS
jgi:hypothetical protein